jgi:putrescine aminotransferase
LSKDGSRLEDERKIGMRLDEVCNDMGLIVRPLINMCVFSPPLIISKSQIDDMFNILEQAIIKVSKEFIK